MHRGWCPFIELNILYNNDASKLLFVKFLKCPFGPGVRLVMCWHVPIMKIKSSPDKQDPSSAEDNFGTPFKQRKLPAAHQCSERQQDICVFAAMTGEVDEGKRQWFFTEPRGIGDGVRTWRWMYEAKNLLAITCFLELFEWPFWPWLQTIPVLNTPLVQTWHGNGQPAVFCKENNFEEAFR